MDFSNLQTIMRSGNQETNSGNTSTHSPQLDLHPGYDGEVSHFKSAGSGPCAASQRHIRTEQKRRDRINEGFVALQALLPGKEKVEKAVMLTQAADYIKQLQSLMQQVLTSGAAKSLPNELQWNLRMLLPRKDSTPSTSNPAPPPPSYQGAPSQTPQGNTQSTMMTQAPVMIQAPQAAVQEVTRPLVTQPVVQPPQYGLQYSEPQGSQQLGMGLTISQGQVVLSEPAAGQGGGQAPGQGQMLMADPSTLQHLQALVQQQQAVQGWHNASQLLQALHVQQQLQQSSQGAPIGITVTPQLLQQLTGAQGMGMYQGQQQVPSNVSVGVPVTNGIPVSAMTTTPMAASAPMSAPPPQQQQQPRGISHGMSQFSQGVTQFPQAPQPNASFAPAATSAFSALSFPTAASAFTPAGSTSLSGLHQLMEAAHASDEEKDGGGSFDMRSPKRPRCYAPAPPKMAKAGILV